VKMHELLVLKEEQSKAKAIQLQAKLEEKKKAKKVTDARKAADAAIDLLKNPLKDFQDALKKCNGGMDEYSTQMNTLLTSKCKVMMEEAMKLLTCEGGVGPSDLTFTITDVKLAQAELLSKTRILV
jgi:hypothetical protein